MTERLQKILSSAGIASRRAAEKMIAEGRVAVNGATASLGMSADPEIDEITVDGARVGARQAMRYIMLNKPRGYVTTLSDERGRRNVAQLVSSAGVRLYPVGRLDMDSEGLLIMTNDGELANKLMHPSHSVKKTYETTVRGTDINKALPVLRSPLEIDGYRIRPAEVEVKDYEDGAYILHITISEGRNRQVRKMCDAAGLKVMRLRRISEGELHLGELPTGKWRELSENEIRQLKKII